KARRQSSANRAKASRTVTFPQAKGRSRVRRTCPSKWRSAKSFMTQPAERIKKTPAIKIKNRLEDGMPAPAKHKAHKQGHNSKRMPIGLLRRIKETYWFKRSAIIKNL